MCGIAGFLLRDQGLSEERLKTVASGMTKTIAHRGPDDFGVWTEARAGVALGHRRLSILDLSAAGRQPMVSACGRFVITYNGEIYNFRELGKTLEKVGWTFRGHSDTEVVLATISEWGLEQALQRINGMFAFALWDREKQRLSLVRDRVGKKPLYYGWCTGAFVFGSELKAVGAYPDFDPQIDRDALGLYMKYSWVPTPYSIYKGIRKLTPGSVLTVAAHSTLETVYPRVYWSARKVAELGDRQPFVGSVEEATDTLDSLLKDAVGCRMVSDVSLGALLSGGIDSTMVVAMMQAESPQPVKTFSIGFGEQEYNEAKHALAIARHLGTDHTELYVTATNAMSVIPDLPRIYDEPFADSSQIPTFLISRLAQREVTVALSGDGGDELFAGYKRYPQSLQRWQNISHVPTWLRAGLAPVMNQLGRASWRFGGPSDSLQPGVTPKRRTIGAKLEKNARWVPALDPADLVAKRHARFRRSQDFVKQAQEVSCLLTNPNEWAQVSEPLQAMMFLDFATYMTDDILVKVDRASMSVSLEVRCPLLDSRLVEFAWSLPMSMRMHAGHGKWVLRRVLERYVPRKLTERPKMGFGVPISEWLRGSLRDWAENLLDETRIREQGLLEPKTVRRIWRQHLSGWRDHDTLLWSMLMFQAWYDDNFNKPGGVR